MNNRKLRFTVLSILVLVMVCLTMLAGCKKDKGDGGDNSSSADVVTVEKSKQPRLIYVQGQDLDFSSGALTITNANGEKTYVPLNDANVSVTGYDKHTLGNQTLTISYNGKTTTLVVAVIARMEVENVEIEYFINEPFNKNKGRVKVASDDGTTSYVEMSDSSITVKSFNNSAAGTTNATIQYTNGSASYECSFPVTVYTPDNITFKKPTKLDYQSHEALNTAGGFLYIEAAKPSTFKKSINLTSEIVSGYNPEAVTDANKDTPVTQTVTVSYAGRTWTYDVTVLYSPLYVIESLASKIENVDLELEGEETLADIKLPQGAGVAAKEAFQKYLLLSDADKNKVDDDLMLSFARVAAFYVNTNDYVNASNALSNAFVLTAQGQLTYVGKDEEAIKVAIKALRNPNSDYNSSSNLLLSIKELYGEEDFNSSVKISQLTSTHTETIANTIADRLEHILTVYDMLKVVPSTWENELKNTEKFASDYGKIITDTVFTIKSSEFTGAKFANLYAVIIRWRSDFFEIIYSYYYYAKEGGKQQITTDLWGTVPAPGLLEDFSNAYNTAYDIGYQLTNQAAGSVMGSDLFVYHYYYLKAIDISKQIKASDNELYTTIYNALYLDDYIEVYLNAPSTKLLGFYDFAGPLLDNENASKVYDAYFAILDVYATTGEIASTSENGQKILNLFNSMVELSPSELHWFLSSISYNYHNYKGVLLMFDYTSGWRNWVAQLLYGFFVAELPQNETAVYAFADLLMAMEVYSTSQFNPDSLDAFKNYMKSVNDKYTTLSSSEKSRFDELVGNAFTKYNTIYNAVLNQDSIKLSDEMSEKFDELYAILDEFNTILNATNEANRYPSLITIYALYQKATLLYEELCTDAQSIAAVKNALNAKLYTVTVEDDDDVYTFSFSVDSYYYYIRSVAYNIIVSNGLYGIANVPSESLVALIPLLKGEIDGTAYTGDINELIAIFRAMDGDELIAFYSIGADVVYFDALKRYADANIKQSNLSYGSAAAKVEEIWSLFEEFNKMYAAAASASATNEQRSMAYTAMVAIYNKAKLIYDELLALASTDADMMNAINYKLREISPATEKQEATYAVLDEYYVYMKSMAANILSASEELINAAEYDNVMALLIKLIPLLKAEATATEYTGNDILNLLADFRALTPEEKYAFYVLQGNLALYAELERYLTEALTADSIIPNLFNAEIYYSLYELDNDDEEALAIFKEKMEAAIEIYKTISAEDKAVIDELYYNDLLAKYNALYPAE